MPCIVKRVLLMNLRRSCNRELDVACGFIILPKVGERESLRCHIEVEFYEN
jgi:hypothetical protein